MEKESKIPLPMAEDIANKSTEDSTPQVIDFNYRGLTDEERLHRAVRDMEIIYASNEPPVMPTTLPRFVKAFLSYSPEFYWPAYSQGALPAAAVLMDKVSFKNRNKLYYPAKIPALVVSESGNGKNGLPYIFNALLHDVMDESHENMNREVEVKEQNSRLGANEKRKAMPQNLVQRIIFTDTTGAGLAQQMKVNNGLPCFLEAKEIEDLYKFKNGAGGLSPTVLLREADDPDGRIRQRRVGEKSVTVDVPFHMNYCISATQEAAISFFKNDMTKGGMNRQEVAFIPPQPIGNEDPEYGDNYNRYVERLQPFVDNLRKTRENAHADEDGRIICRQAIILSKQLKGECAAYAQATQDTTWDKLTHRGLVHALLKSCVIWAANGCKWEPAIEPFIRWTLHYCLWSKLAVFGDKIREAESKVKLSTKPGKPNLLTLITTNIFTLQDAIAMRKTQSMDESEKATKNMLNVWVSRGWIKRLADGRYEKLEYKVSINGHLIQ